MRFRLIATVGRVVLSALAFAGFFAGGAILSWIILPVVAYCTRDQHERVIRCQIIVQRSFRVFHSYTRLAWLLRFDSREVETRIPAGPVVVVANHPTLVDITALIAILGPACFVAKSPLFANRSLGRLLGYCWHIESNIEGKALGGSSVVDQALERLAAGLSVVVFPEGTRSPEGGLGRFRRGAFEIAVRANVPVVAFLIGCEPAFLSKSAPWYRTPHPVPVLSVTQMAILRPDQWNGDSHAMCRSVKEMYEAVLDIGCERRPELGGEAEPRFADVQWCEPTLRAGAER